MSAVASSAPPKSRAGEAAVGYAAALIALAGLTALGLFAAGRAGLLDLSPLSWYLVRASGLAAYVGLWAATVWGLGMTTSRLDRLGGRAMVLSVHAYLTLLAYGFLGFHLLMLAVDPYTMYGVREFTLPFRSGWREPWTGFGVIALWLFIVVGVTSSYRTRIGQRAFRLVHWLAFPLYLSGLAHGVGAGTDTGLPWAQGLYVLSGAVVAWLVGVRVMTGPRDRQRSNRGGGRSSRTPPGAV